MKIQYVLILLSSCFFLACNDVKIEMDNDFPEKEIENITEANSKKEESTFDPALAAKYGADEYGMKTYVMAILKVGPNREIDPEKANELQAAHMENIGKLTEDGTLLVAGPFYGDAAGDHRGIYIFDVETIEEAEALTNTDPAIQAGSLVMELRQFYCSAALMAINDLHNKITKTHF